MLVEHVERCAYLSIDERLLALRLSFDDRREVVLAVSVKSGSPQFPFDDDFKPAHEVSDTISIPAYFYPAPVPPVFCGSVSSVVSSSLPVSVVSSSVSFSLPSFSSSDAASSSSSLPVPSSPSSFTTQSSHRRRRRRRRRNRSVSNVLVKSAGVSVVPAVPSLGSQPSSAIPVSALSSPSFPAVPLPQSPCPSQPNMSVAVDLPSSWKQAVAVPGNDEWKEAIDREIEVHANNKTWVRVEPPADENVISSRWVLARNRAKDVEKIVVNVLLFADDVVVLPQYTPILKQVRVDFCPGPSPAALGVLFGRSRYLVTADSTPFPSCLVDDPGPPQLSAYCRYAWASDPVTRKSRTVFVILLAGRPICWRSVTQSVVAKSSIEAAIFALAHCCKKLLALRALLEERGHSQDTHTVFMDTQAAFVAGSYLTIHKGLRHTGHRYQFVRECTARELIRIVSVRSWSLSPS